MSDSSSADVFEALWIMAAFVRLSDRTDWDVGDRVTQLDVALLESAGFLVRENDAWTTGPALRELVGDLQLPHVQGALRAMWLRAAAHASGASAGWTATDPDLLRSQGRGSAAVPALIESELLDLMPGVRDRLSDGGAFLDVGVGVGALALSFARLFPAAQIVGIDVFSPALAVAREDVAASGMSDRIEVREASVTDMADCSVFTLAWLPQPFISPKDLAMGLPRVLEALIPGGWLVMPIAESLDDDAIGQRVIALEAALLGGGLTTASEVVATLTAAGFDQAASHQVAAGTFAVARRPL